MSLGLLLLPRISTARAQSTDPAKVFAKAVAAQQRGDVPAAITLYESLLRRAPDALAARANLAGLLTDSGRFGEAIAQYTAALHLAPANRDLRRGLAYAYGRRGGPDDLSAAIRELEPLHQADPSDDQTSMLLGDAYFRRQRYADAVRLLQPLGTARPEDRDLQWILGSSLIRSGHAAEGVTLIDALAQDGDVDARLLAGETRLNLQQFDVARRDAEAAVRQDPNLPAAQILLGRVLEHAGDYDAAERALRTGLGAVPADFNAQFYLGALLLFKRNLPEAETHLRRALELEPGSADARYKLALVEQGQGQTDAAVRDLQRVVRDRPRCLEPQAKLLALLFRLHRTREAEQVKANVERLTAEQQVTGQQTPVATSPLD